jgi:hypothetical protein
MLPIDALLQTTEYKRGGRGRGTWLEGHKVFELSETPYNGGIETVNWT